MSVWWWRSQDIIYLSAGQEVRVGLYPCDDLTQDDPVRKHIHLHRERRREDTHTYKGQRRWRWHQAKQEDVTWLFTFHFSFIWTLTALSKFYCRHGSQTHSDASYVDWNLFLVFFSIIYILIWFIIVCSFLKLRATTWCNTNQTQSRFPPGTHRKY